MKYEVFISYRRTASETATLIAEKLRSFGYRVFLDVETLNSGKFNEQLLDEIAQCKDFVVVLPENALDRCVEEDDWVRREVCCAMEHGKNIIPVMLRNFSWPSPMPEGMEELQNYQAVTAGSHEYFDLAMQRLAGYLKSRPRTKYHTALIRSSIIVSAIVFCLLAAFFVFRKLSTPVCTDAANSLTSEMEVVNQLAGISHDLEKDWETYFLQLASARMPQRVLDLQSDMLSRLDYCKEQVQNLQSGIPAFDFTYSDYKAFLLALHGIQTAELLASESFVRSMFEDLNGNIDFARDIVETMDYESILTKTAVDIQFDTYQCSSDLFYYGYMELMSYMPSKSLTSYETLSPKWTYISHAVSLSLKPEEYQRLQQLEINRIEQILESAKSASDAASAELDALAQRLDEMVAQLQDSTHPDEMSDLFQAELNARTEKLNADREYVALRKQELAELDRKYEASYNQLLAQCQLNEDDDPNYMWGKIVHWGRSLGTLVASRRAAEEQGVYSTSAVTPARALAEMNSLLSCYQTYNPESAVFIPSVKAFYQAVTAGRYPLKGVLIFGFKNDAVHPLYKAGDIVIERNGASVTNYSELTAAAKLTDGGGTVKFLRLEDGKLREHFEPVPKSDVLVGYMELTEGE